MSQIKKKKKKPTKLVGLEMFKLNLYPEKFGIIYLFLSIRFLLKMPLFDSSSTIYTPSNRLEMSNEECLNSPLISPKFL